MASGTVAYVPEIVCPSCGLRSPGYLEVLPGGHGTANCPRCGAAITQDLPADYVPQIPPPDFASPAHPHVRRSHYPGLYNQPKHAPSLDLADLLRVFVSPAKAFASLYLSTNMQRAMALVVVFSILYSTVSTIVTAGLSEVVGYQMGDFMEAFFFGFASFVVSLLAFLIFGLTAAAVAKTFFGGRGERGSTISLAGYCYPVYILVSIILLLTFSLGFGGLDFESIDSWTPRELGQSMVAGVILFVAIVLGLIWLLWVTSRAISVANDVSMSEAIMTSILAAIAAGMVYIVAGSIMRMPIGLTF